MLALIILCDHNIILDKIIQQPAKGTKANLSYNQILKFRAKAFQNDLTSLVKFFFFFLIYTHNYNINVKKTIYFNSILLIDMCIKNPVTSHDLHCNHHGLSYRWLTTQILKQPSHSLSAFTLFSLFSTQHPDWKTCFSPKTSYVAPDFPQSESQILYSAS